ncbi:hypothetical protein ACFQV4_17345 [Streptomyces thermocarboxydus]
MLSTGSPSTAHTDPSSAYSRAVTWWVPRGKAPGARWYSGVRSTATRRPFTSRCARPRPASARRPVPSGEKRKLRTRSRTSQPPSASGATSTVTWGAPSSPTSR